MKNLIINVPRLEIHRPPISTAIIANAIKSAGFDVETLDLNCEFFHWLSNQSAYYDFDQVWDRERPLTLKEFKNIVKFIKAKSFLKIDRNERIFISVFGGSCHIFTRILCKIIRKYFKNKVIILGGQGVKTPALALNKISFGEDCKKKQLCDVYITGEGEKTVIDICRGIHTGPGINNNFPVQLDDLDSLPFPDYSFYNLDRYDYLENEKEVFIVGSRGCVRNCTYCDVAKYWPKFRYRSGNNIAHEMIMHYEKHGVTKFYFTDSLINGSMKAFLEMCNTLAKYNTTHKTRFRWGGQFIFKPKHQLPLDYFEIIEAAGGKEFYVGVESGSDKIRWEMDKKFTNSDIEFHLEGFSKNNLHVFFLMLMGYVSETKKDHNENINMFKKWQKYVATGTIRGIDLGVSLIILEGTPLHMQLKDHEIFFLNSNLSEVNEDIDPLLWQSKKNVELDIPERIRRRIEVHKEAIKYSWPIWRGAQRLKNVRNLLVKYEKHIAQKNSLPAKNICTDGLHFFDS